MLTLVPIEWTRETSADSPREPIAYEVAGLPGERRAVISMAPRGWRLVEDLVTDKINPAARYSTAEEALEALKAAVQGEEAERPPTF